MARCLGDIMTAQMFNKMEFKRITVPSFLFPSFLYLLMWVGRVSHNSHDWFLVLSPKYQASVARSGKAEPSVKKYEIGSINS